MRLLMAILVAAAFFAGTAAAVDAGRFESETAHHRVYVCQQAGNGWKPMQMSLTAWRGAHRTHGDYLYIPPPNIPGEPTCPPAD